MDPYVFPEKQRVFKFQLANGTWWADCTPLTYDSILQMDQGVLCTSWQRLIFERITEPPAENDVLADSINFYPFVPVFSLRACIALKHHFAFGQLLPIEVSGHDFFVYKPLVGCRAIGMKSPFTVTVFPTDVLAQNPAPQSLHPILPPLAACTNFHVVTPSATPHFLFVRQQFIDDVLAAGLTGMEFVEVIDFDYVC